MKFFKKKTSFSRILVFIIILFSTTYAYSTPLEGPTMPKKGHWVTGLQFNNVTDQDIHYLKGKAESKDYYLNLSYGIFDNLTLDGKLGVGNVSYFRDGAEDLNYSNGFSGGYGLRYKILKEEEHKVTVIVGLHHVCVHPHSVSDNEGLNQEVIWDDWQLDSLVSKTFGKFSPYVGVKVKRAYLLRRVSHNKQRMKSDVEGGGAVGFDYRFTKSIYLNTEVRFIDEQAYSVGLSYLW